MTNQTVENIFADYGTIVQGDRFIGREQDLQVIESRVILPNDAGNLALVGDTRIGKSSLVYHAVIEQKQRLLARKIIPVWINLGTYARPLELFRSLVTNCLAEIEDLNWATEPIRKAAARAVRSNAAWAETYDCVQRFFKKVRDSGYRVLFVLDEFDHARNLFNEDTSSFQGLRELSYRPEWRVHYITTSRRPIFEIERQTRAISTFDGIFKKHYVGMFDDTGLDQFYEKIAAIGIDVTPELRDRIRHYCGGHPYLLEMMGYELLEYYRDTQTVNIEQVARLFTPSCLAHYDRMVELLREEDRLGKLMQVLFGPLIDANQNDVEELLQYAFIKTTQEGTYEAFSAHFQTFLGVLHRESESDLWPIWAETESALRRVITSLMTDKYGEEWILKLKQARPNLKDLLERCRQAQQRELSAFGDRASPNLIDYSYPRDLFAIIFAEWHTFRTIFGRDKSYWDQRAQLLGKIRTPLAHNRLKAIQDYEQQIADGYCREILAVIGIQLTTDSIERARDSISAQ